MSKSEEPLLDFEKICRLCLLEKRSMSSIFAKKKSDKKVPLAVRIMSCAALELYEGDGLPASICSKCLLSVNQSYAFKEQCEQADTTLRQYAQRMNEARGVTSSNREPRERIANDSLARTEDNGIKIAEHHCDEDKDVKQNSLDLNCGKVEISSAENSRVTFQENQEFSFVKTRSLENLETDKSFNVENESEQSGISEVSPCKGDISKSSKVEAKSVGGNSKKANLKKENLGFFESSFLKALTVEKAENVEVVADMPDVSEGEDWDFGKTGREKDDSSTKTKTHKRFKNGFRLNDTFLSGRTKISKKSRCENKKHLELIQNLMRNKNIIVQKRSACTSTGLLTGKISSLKNQEFNKNMPRKKGFSFPHEFKIAQLWKEWEEVNKRIPNSSEKLPTKPENVVLTEAVKNNIDVPASGDNDRLQCIASREFESETKRKSGKDTVYCKDCAIFLQRSSYSNHVKFVHKKIRKYLCQTCGYAACTGTILRQHVQAVHVGYSFFCDQCPRKFNLMKRLRRHIELQHSGKPIERNHICQYCGMTFAKSGCLKRHVRSHTQETPYQCQYCQRRFKYRWPKVQHERLHTGEKPYKCSFCEERFTQNCLRKIHEYKKHGNEEFKPKTLGKVKKENEKKEDTKASNFDSG